MNKLLTTIIRTNVQIFILISLLSTDKYKLLPLSIISKDEIILISLNQFNDYIGQLKQKHKYLNGINVAKRLEKYVKYLPIIINQLKNRINKKSINGSCKL